MSIEKKYVPTYEDCLNIVTVFSFDFFVFWNLRHCQRCDSCWKHSYVESTYVTVSFHQEGRFRHIQLVEHTHFFLHWSVCAKPGKWVVMYLCKEYRICLFSQYLYLDFLIVPTVWYCQFSILWKRTKLISYSISLFMLLWNIYFQHF